MQIIHCEQGSQEWYTARLGIPTSSEFKKLVGVKKPAEEKKTRQEYMDKLAGETLTGRPMDSYTNVHMERGKEWEDDARHDYAFARDVEPMRVGFIRDGNKGCSPDSLIGEDGGLEIKTALEHIQIARLRADVLPSEHKFQVHGCLWVAQRQWWDFVSYCPGLPLFVKRVERDEEIIKQLADAVDQFNVELNDLIQFVRGYGQTGRAA